MATYKCADCQAIFNEDEDPPIEIRTKFGHPIPVCMRCYEFSDTDYERTDPDLFLDIEEPEDDPNYLKDEEAA